MSSKKPFPVLTKTSKPSGVGTKGLIVLLLLLLIIVVGYFVWSRSLSNTHPVAKETPADAQPTAVEGSSNLVSDTDKIDNDSIPVEITEPAEVESAEAQMVLNAPLPETDSLAKEEIDRLEDERQRLAEQEKLTTEQITMSQQLTDMKADQIQLIEQQIAQLEAAKKAEVGMP